MVYIVYKYTLGGNFNDPDFHSIHDCEKYAQSKCLELARMQGHTVDFSIRVSSTPNAQFPRTDLNNRHHIVGKMMWECASTEELSKSIVLTYGFMCADDFEKHEFARVALGLTSCPEEYYYADYTLNKDIIDDVNEKCGFETEIFQFWSIFKPQANIYFGKMDSIDDIINM